MVSMPPFPRILATTALCLAAGAILNSCRLALHTLPDAVGKQEFVTHFNYPPGMAVYNCEGVLYAKLPGHYVRPRVALFETYHVKDEDWKNGLGWSCSSRPHIEDTTLYLPLDREMVSVWNEQNREMPLQFVRYQSGILTEEQMQAKQSKLIAHGLVYGELMTAINDAASRKSFAHYALKPIAIPLELVDTLSTFPLSAATAATGFVVGVPAVFIYESAGQIQKQDAPQVEPAQMPAALEPRGGN